MGYWCGRGGLSQVGCPFLGGLRSEWTKTGHGERGGSKKAENGWTSFVHGPLGTIIGTVFLLIF